ncbi:MAG: creatininase family protein [Rickettsiales bacterium]
MNSLYKKVFFLFLCGFSVIAFINHQSFATIDKNSSRVIDADIRVDDEVYIERMTSPEVRKKIDSGMTTVIIPTGGSEQNGRHMIIGKHNIIVRYTAGEIAKELGNALVAPVVKYVPEGNINPPQGHMKFAGTFSLREQTYRMLLEDIAASLKQHGFKLICFIGDSGGNQAVQVELAADLSNKWKDKGVNVLQVSDYYDNNGQSEWIKKHNVPLQDYNTHAGFEDTSELMAIDEDGVRKELVGKYTIRDFNNVGSTGDSTLASAEYGRYLLKLKIETAVRQIKNAAANEQ